MIFKQPKYFKRKFHFYTTELHYWKRKIFNSKYWIMSNVVGIYLHRCFSDFQHFKTMKSFIQKIFPWHLICKEGEKTQPAWLKRGWGTLEHGTFGLTFPPASCPPWGSRLETTILSTEAMSTAALHGSEKESGPLSYACCKVRIEKRRWRVGWHCSPERLTLMIILISNIYDNTLGNDKDIFKTLQIHVKK